MKISQKLTLSFAGIIAVILLATNVFIYYFSVSFTKESFYTRLNERALIAATEYLKRDEHTAYAIQETHKLYLQSMPGEIIKFYDSLNRPQFVDTLNKISFNPAFINDIRKKGFAKEEEPDGNQSAGIYFKDNQGNFVIIARAYDSRGNSTLQFLQRILIFVFFGGIIIVAIAGIFFVRQSLKPIAQIVKEVNKITATNLHLRVNEGNGNDEIARLAITFNNMLIRLEDSFVMQKNFVSNASHELRTPLTSILSAIEVTLSQARNNEEYIELLNGLHTEAEKMNKLITNLMNLSQAIGESETYRQTEEVRIDELLFEINREAKTNWPDIQISMDYKNLPDDASRLVVRGNRNLLYAAVYNVMENACKFTKTFVKCTLEVNNKNVQITIKDNGIGIPAADVKNILQTFYRSHNARSFPGSGIGLALAEKIISIHKGSITITSVEKEGTEVNIVLPVK